MAIDALGLENATELRIAAVDPDGDPIADLATLLVQDDLVTVSAFSGPNITYRVTDVTVDHGTHYAIPVAVARGSGGLPQADEAMRTQWTIAQDRKRGV